MTQDTLREKVLVHVMLPQVTKYTAVTVPRPVALHAIRVQMMRQYLDRTYN